MVLQSGGGVVEGADLFTEGRVGGLSGCKDKASHRVKRKKVAAEQRKGTTIYQTS